MSPDPLILDHYREHGYVKLPGFLPAAELKTVEAEIQRLADRGPSAFDKGHFYLAQDERTIQQIEHLQAYSSYFADMMKSDRRVLDIVEAIFGAAAVGNNVSYMAKPARVGEVVPYHQDNAYYGYLPPDALSVWIALDESNERNGCLRVVPGSHKDGLRRHGPTGVRGISYGLADPVDPQPDGEVAIVLRRGDASVHHCCTFHSSHPNLSERSRRGLILFYHCERCRIDQSVLDDYALARERMIAEAGE
jgi:phytanoyl-CoA hydroxylase